MLRLGSSVLLAAYVVRSAIAAERPDRHIARRQDQYASFTNSSSSVSTVSDTSRASDTSVSSSTSDTPYSSSLTLDSTSSSASDQSSSSLDGPYFTFDPQTTTNASPSPAPSMTSIVRTASLSGYGYDSSSETSTSVSDVPPYPTTGGFTYAPTTASRVAPPVKQQCVGQVVNVQNASYDFWNPITIDHAVSTLSFQHDAQGKQTGWTILPAEEPFTLSNEFRRYECDDNKPVIKTDAETNDTYTMYECSWVPITVAAATTATTVSAFKQPTATTGTSLDVPPNIRPTQPPDPSTTFPAVNATFAPNTGFVYFTNYEIETGETTTFSNGSGACVRSTQSYNLSEPYALTYTGPDFQAVSDPAAAVTGDVDKDFLSHIGRANATAGSFTALPTVIVIVEEVFKASLILQLAKTMASAPSLDTPTAVLPSGFTAAGTDDNGWASDLYNQLTSSAHVETTAQVLLVPPPSSTTKVVSALNQQPESTKNADNNTPVRVNDGKPAPSDANDVLSDAIQSAILQGIGETLAPSTTKPNVNILGSTGTPTSVSAVVVGGQTAVAGGAPVNVGGTQVSIPASGDSVVVGDTTTKLSGGSPTFVVDGLQLTATQASAFNIAGQTLVAGGSQITVGGSEVSFATGGNAVVIGSSTLMLNPPPVITVGSATITADAATRFVLGPGQTLTPGGVATVSGTTISLDRSGTKVVVNGQTSAVAVATANSALITPAPVLIIDGQEYSASGGKYVISGQTLQAGGAITFTGKNGVETVSLDRSGTVVVNVISGKSTTTTLTASAAAITLGGQVFTATSGSTYVIAGQTLTPGGVKTVVVGGSTYVLSLAATPTAVVIQTIGSGGRATATTTEYLVASNTGAASAPNKAGPTGAAATNAPATGQASSTMMEMLTALFGAAALAAAAFL